MRTVILFLLLIGLTPSIMAQQYNQLLLRKNGITIKRFTEGSEIRLRSKLGMQYSGIIYLIQNDSLYFSNAGIHIRDVATVYKRIKKRLPLIPFGKDAFLYANAGIPLFTAGLMISGEPFLKSFLAGTTLVYAPILLYNIKRVISGGNRHYILGNKFDLVVLDIHPAEIVPQKYP